MNLIITGSIAFDYLMNFSGSFSDSLVEGKLDKISVSFLVDSLNKRNGGCAANIAYTLALLGEKPVLTGAAGVDFGPYEELLKNAGVDTAGVHKSDSLYTASFFANTDKNNNQIASFYPGAMQLAANISLEQYKNKSSLVIISPNDPGAMSRHADECRRFGLDFIYDPGQQIAWLDGAALKACAAGSRILILNEYEHEMFLKKTEMTKSQLFDLAKTVIVTLGDKGAEIREPGRKLQIPTAKEKQLLDPTGVGDAFRSGLLTGLQHGFDWEICGRLGSLAAAYVIETDGPQNHSFTLPEFKKRYSENFGASAEIDRL